MKNMSDRKMDMNKGAVDSDGYFPSDAQHKKLARVGEATDMKYHDTEELVKADSQQNVSATNKNRMKPGFRH